MSDYISRQEAIDAYILHTMDYLEGKKPKRAFTEVLRELPSAQSKRENVRGEWIEDNPRDKSMMWRCSVCGRIAYYPTIGERKSYKKHCGYNYCPNCGADMRPISALSENAEIVSNLKRGES